MSVIHELAEASRRGKIIALHPDLTEERISLGTDWAMPSFDYGNFSLDNPSSMGLFDEKIESDLRICAGEILNAGFSLPFPRFALITRDKKTINVDIIEEKYDLIHYNFYYRMLADGSPWGVHPDTLESDSKLSSLISCSCDTADEDLD